MSAFPDLEAARARTSTEALRLRQQPTQHPNGGSKEEENVAKYGDTSTTYWKLYASEAQISDKKFIESLRGDTGSMVFLNSLFSSIIASFIIEIYKTLLPDGSQQTTSQSNPSQSPFQPSSVAIRVNVILFISFFLSITSAVACALIQQWCYEYLEHAYPRAAPHECGRVRTYLHQGLNRFQMRRFMYGTYVLLHLSLFLFLWAISDFFYTVHTSLGTIARYCLVAAVVAYVALSISTLIFSNSPYNTPLTPPLRASGILLLYGFRIALWSLQRLRDPNKSLTSEQRQYIKRLRFDRGYLYLLEASKRVGDLERYAMEWLFEKNDFSDKDMDKFLEALPGYMSSRHTAGAQEYLTADYILERISKHFLTCATSLELSEETTISRVLCCVRSLQLISQHGMKPGQNPPEEADKKKLRLQKTYNERLIYDLKMLCDMEDPVVALRASCIRALAIQGLLTMLAQTEEGTTHNRPFPTPLIPLYDHLLFPDGKEMVQELGDGYVSDDEEGKKMWKVLLSDGPLLNLTMLAKAVHSQEHPPQSSLSFCWKTFDMLVKQLGIALTEASNETRVQFTAMRNKASEHIQKKEQGFRIVPLLDILDVVDRGQRLLVAFSNHPEYHSGRDVVFGKEHLRNGDLLKAFARCLPDYVASIGQDECRKFMEGIVCDDGLWASLQVNLWNAQRSDVPIPDKLRVFEDCCTVIDVAFSSLEGSTKMDWRAPEFGSLAHQFETFINHSFQGSFMARATSFRVGVIRARCCKALLAQFCDDVERDGTIFFRSQWDVASLARLFWTLGIGDGKESDTEFWKPYINGGQIGAEFAIKARETIDQAARDGSLLTFYKLGRLATMAVPLHGSGLVLQDLEKVWDLQRSMVNDQHLPLNRASDQVWERVDRLRTEVNHLGSNLSGEERDRLNPLLEMIDEILPRSQTELMPNERADAQVPVTPASPPWKQDDRVDRSNFSSESTETTRGLSGATLTSENSYREPFADTISNIEASTQTPLSSSYNDEAGPYSLSSPYPTMQSIPSGGIMDPTTGIGGVPLSALPVSNLNLSYIGNIGQRRTTPSHQPLMRSSSAFGVAGPNPSIRTSTSTLPKSRKTVPVVLRDPAISSRHVPSDLDDPGQTSISQTPGPNFEVGEDK